jgi:hypothetical protein
MSDIYVPLEDYEALWASYCKVTALLDEHLPRSFLRLEAKTPAPRFTLKPRLEPLDVAKEDHPL